MKTPEQIAQEVFAELSTPEGQQRLRESMERVEQTIALLRPKLTWQEWHELIHRPFNI